MTNTFNEELNACSILVQKIYGFNNQRFFQWKKQWIILFSLLYARLYSIGTYGVPLLPLS